MTLAKRPAIAGLACLALMAAVAPAHAAPVVVARNLDNPRGLALAPNGRLYVAEAGRGGSLCLDEGTCYGFTSRIARIDPSGRLPTVVGGLFSVGQPDGTYATGVDDVALDARGRVFGVLTTVKPSLAGGLSGSARRQVARVVRASRGKRVFGGPRLDTIENRSNPDNGEVESDPYGLAIAPDGTQYVADAGGNTILRVRNGKVSVAAVMPKLAGGRDAVPSAIRFGPDGALYIGTLGGDGTPTDGSKVYRFVPGRSLTVYADGFSNITGIAFGPDLSLYVSELYRGDGDAASTGDVVRAAPDGTRTRIGLGDLPYPSGVAVARDGTVYVSILSVAPGITPAESQFGGLGGQVVKFTQP